MTELQKFGSYFIKKGDKFLTGDYKWSSRENKSVQFDTKNEALLFLEGKRVKGAVYASREVHKITTRENGSTVVEFNSELVKV